MLSSEMLPSEAYNDAVLILGALQAVIDWTPASQTCGFPALSAILFDNTWIGA